MNPTGPTTPPGNLPPITINLPPTNQPDIPGLLDKLHGLYSDFSLYVIGVMAFVGAVISILVPIYLKMQNDASLETVRARFNQDLENTMNKVKEEVEGLEEKLESQRSEMKIEVEKSKHLTIGLGFMVKAQLIIPMDNHDKMNILDNYISASLALIYTDEKNAIPSFLPRITEIINELSRNDIENPVPNLAHSIKNLLEEIKKNSSYEGYLDAYMELKDALDKALHREASL